ncbi:type VII toxin-antitoxin system MntA family adenylyltransferase antitoxin [uncultured Clostridium sp.]|uniref:type VII toxin-antitoxin system MntA family adenylyltransferase antitoxin n=1 Tax=uncultured Clostridium sp. TaxID=59620 RepID=UPI0028F149FC|nr:nucleotidyltransferase domain-containing protein [uncultured Clostridium sp.]
MDHKLIYKKIEDLIPKDKVDALYLFGSYADGTFTENSDIDLAIFSDNLSYIELVDLEDKISERLNKEVDLVLPEKSDFLLSKEIF